MSDAEGRIEISDESGVRTLRIDRPESRNALLPSMYEALAKGLAELERSPDLRVGLLCASGENFCAGNDLDNFSEVARAAADGKVVLAGDSSQGLLLHALGRLQKPLVAAVDGAAIGIGFTALLHADIVVATERAVFGAPFGQLGLCPEAGSSLTLPRLLGRQRTLEIFLLGRRLSAQEAVAVGLVSSLVAPENLLSTATAHARALARLPAHAVRATRRLVDAPAEPMSARIDRELEAFAACLGEAETQATIATVREQLRAGRGKAR